MRCLILCDDYWPKLNGYNWERDSYIPNLLEQMIKEKKK